MAKKILLSLVLCAFVFCTFSTTSFAMTTEQKELKTRIDTLYSLIGMKRSDMMKKMQKPESMDSGDFICTYHNGLSSICLKSLKESAKASATDTINFITAKMAPSHHFTMDQIMGALGSGIPFGKQLLIQREGCQYIASFDDAGNCTEIQLAEI